MQLLICLVANRNNPISRNELMSQLWPSSKTTESSLTRAISELRKALGDRRNPAYYIDTIQRYGYKAVAPFKHIKKDYEIGSEIYSITPKSDIDEIELMARYLLARRNEADLRKAIRLLSDYIKNKEQHSQIYALLAYMESILDIYADVPSSIHLQRARKLANTAIKINPYSGLGFAVLGTLDNRRWHWKKSLEHFERAYNLTSDDPIILHTYAELLMNLGRADKASRLMDLCCSLQPNSAGTRLVYAWVLLHSDESKSILELQKARQLGADNVFTDNLECLVFHRKGWGEDAIQKWSEFNFTRQNNSSWIWSKPLIEAIHDPKARSSLAKNIEERVNLDELDAGLAPFILTLANLLDPAFEMAERAVHSQCFFIMDPWLSPEMDAFRQDPRFQYLLDRIGLKHFYKPED